MATGTTFTVRSVKRLKSGRTGSRMWALFEVQADGGRRFTSFDAEWSRHVGERVTWPAPLNGDARLGKFPKAPQRAPETRVPPAAPAAAAPDRFKVLDRKLDAILVEVRAIRAHFTEFKGGPNHVEG